MANYAIRKDYYADNYENYAIFSGAILCMFYFKVSEEDNNFSASQTTIRT